MNPEQQQRALELLDDLSTFMSHPDPNVASMARAAEYFLDLLDSHTYDSLPTPSGYGSGI